MCRTRWLPARSCPRKPSKGSNSAVVSKGRLAGSMRRRSTSTGSAPGADGSGTCHSSPLLDTSWRDAFFDAGIVNQRIGRGLLLTVNVESLLHSPIACWRSSGRPRRAGRRHQLLHRSKVPRSSLSRERRRPPGSLMAAGSRAPSSMCHEKRNRRLGEWRRVTPPTTN